MNESETSSTVTTGKSNFSFLKEQNGYYDLFADACIEAERAYATSSAMCALACRKALELAVRWVYAADSTIKQPYKDNLGALLYEPTFKDALNSGNSIWPQLVSIKKIGNQAAHTKKKIRPELALSLLNSLFIFVDWIDYCYGPNYVERTFDDKKVPKNLAPVTDEQIEAMTKAIADAQKTKKQNIALENEIKKMRTELAAAKAKNVQEREPYKPKDFTEAETRKLMIDTDFVCAGWTLGSDVTTEHPVTGMPKENPSDTGEGSVDYVMWGKDGLPLALLEAKRTSHSVEKGLKQARIYADCLEAQYHVRPLIFLSNGYQTMFVHDEAGAPRQVSFVFSRDDIQKITAFRKIKEPASATEIDRRIVGGKNRNYQLTAVRRVLANIDEGNRKSLLVMATGTGKTRVAGAIAEALMHSGYVKNVLFLADRKALVRQAKHSFQKFLPDTTLCNLVQNKDDSNARIVFSTYQTMMNVIDNTKDESGALAFSPAHFDLIIIDEAHRTIFKKYRYIFAYFDAYMVGLTATPASEVDRNTYEIFGLETGVPTSVYEYDEALKDHVLVPFTSIETSTDFLDNGITYNDLSDEQKEILDDDFEDEPIDTPEKILPSEINRWIMNEDTVNKVLSMLMEKGIKVDNGQTIGKSIIFAQNQKHARFIIKCFRKLFPKLPGDYIQLVVSSDDYSHKVIDDFETKPMPAITVSVDMMDTGIDVPAVVNLVFFKKVRSRIKFWQMLGRGTRLCPGLNVVDPEDGFHQDKTRFLVFDWCKNFAFFNEQPETREGKIALSVAETIFNYQARLAYFFQEADYAAAEYQNWRKQLVEGLVKQVRSLNEAQTSVRLNRESVLKFKRPESYQVLTARDLKQIEKCVAPLIHNSDRDNKALTFDTLMYAYMLATCYKESVEGYRDRVIKIAAELLKKVSIPQVNAKVSTLKQLTDETFYEDINLFELEHIREEIRNLVQFIERQQRPVIETHLIDNATKSVINGGISTGESYVNYDLKVKRYLQDYATSTVIEKLRTNKPMTKKEYKELERIFTQELGSKQDYAETYGDTPFGLLVRQLVQLDHKAAEEAFSDFLAKEPLNSQQISFVEMVVDQIANNGYIETTALSKPPFDRPRSFVRMFDRAQQTAIVNIIKSVKRNAENPAA